MADSRGLRETWLRPFFFYGNNPTSLIGGALTSAAAFTLIGYWVVSFLGHGGSSNPYVGIIFYLLLPGLFMLGLVLIAVGILLRRQHLKASGQIPSIFPNC
jgi:ABC-type multidrug transport system permease subunit